MKRRIISLLTLAALVLGLFPAGALAAEGGTPMEEAAASETIPEGEAPPAPSAGEETDGTPSTPPAGEETGGTPLTPPAGEETGGTPSTPPAGDETDGSTAEPKNNSTPEPEDNGDMSLMAGEAVAAVTVDEVATEYSDIQNAWSAARSQSSASTPATVTLKRSVYVSNKPLEVGDDDNIVLEGGTYELQGSSASPIWQKGGTLTIRSGNILGGSSFGTVRVSGKTAVLNIESDSVKIENTYGPALGIENCSEVTIKGGAFACTGSYTYPTIQISPNAGKKLGDLLEPEHAYYQVDGGTETLVTGTLKKTELPKGTYTVKACTHPENAKEWKLTSDDHAFICSACGKADGTPQPHTFDATGECNVCHAKKTAKVTSGNEESIFFSIEEAWEYAAAHSPATVTMLNDAVSSKPLRVGSRAHITFEGGDYTLSAKLEGDSLFAGRPDSTLIVKSGNMTCNRSCIASDGTVQISGGTFTYTGTSDVCAAISISGTAQISGGTFISTKGKRAVYNEHGKLSDLLPNYDDLAAEKRYAFFKEDGTLVTELTENELLGTVTVTECTAHAVDESTPFVPIDAAHHGKICPACGGGTNLEAHTLPCEICQGKFVASVTAAGETKEYLSLASAFRAAQRADSATVTLLDNVVLTEPVMIDGGNITLEGGEYEISANITEEWEEHSALYMNGGALTIASGTITATGEDDFCAGVMIDNGALTINGGKISASTDGVHAYAGNPATLTINGGEISAVEIGVYYGATGEFTITGGTISATGTSDYSDGVYAYSGTLTITGGTISGTTSGLTVANNFAYDVAGGAFISGGKAIVKTDDDENALNPMELLREGYIYYKDGNPVPVSTDDGDWNTGTVTVKLCEHNLTDNVCANCGLKVEDAEARVVVGDTDTFYANVSAAWDAATAATEHAKVVLLKDGFTYDPLVVSDGDDITLTSESETQTLLGMIQVTGGKLEIRNCDIKIEIDSDEEFNGITVSGGEVTIDGSKILIAMVRESPEFELIGCGMYVTGGAVAIKRGEFGTEENYIPDEVDITNNTTAIKTANGVTLGGLLYSDPVTKAHSAYSDGESEIRQETQRKEWIAVNPCSGTVTPAPTAGDTETHTYACSACGFTETEAHSFSGNEPDAGGAAHTASCGICEYKKTEPHTFTYAYEDADSAFTKACEACAFRETHKVTQSEPQLTFVFGTEKTLSVTAEPASDEFTWQWYKGESALSGADSAEYALPTDLAVGAHAYSCKVTFGEAEHTFEFSVTVSEVPPEAYTVTYDANGGAGEMDSLTAEENEAVTLPGCGFTAPEGKMFDCWAAGSADGTRVPAGGSFTVTGNITFYAVWKDRPAVTYTVTYRANGGTGTMPDGIAEPGVPFVLPECGFTAPAGQRFAGWSIGGTTGVVVPAGGSYIFTDDRNVFAVWQELPPEAYAITYDANGGSGAMPAGTAMKGIPFTLPGCGFEAPAGKVFEAWHIGGTSGTSVKPGEKHLFTTDATVRAIWKDAPPVVWQIAFQPNGGTGAAPVQADTAEGGTFRLPESPFTREGFQFSGWGYGGVIYPAGTIFTMPGRDVTFAAQWTQIVYKITGIVMQDGAAAPGAAVKLMRGMKTMAEATADENGRFTFTGVPVGMYNLRVEKDGVMRTVKQEITGSDAEMTILLPTGKTNSVVEVKNENTPPVIVGNLDKVFEDATVYRPEDKAVVESGGTVEFKLTIQKEDAPAEAAKIETVRKADETVSMYLDLTLVKTVTRPAGTTTSSRITELGSLIESLIPLPAEMQGKASYIVYRVHDGKAERLPQDSGEEYYTVSSDKTSMSIFSRKYSTYAIAWSDRTDAPSEPVVPTRPARPSGSGGSGGARKYAVAVEPSANGRVAPDRASAASGATVTLTVIPDEGYELLELSVTDSQGNPVRVTQQNTFVMPAASVTVKASFAPLAEQGCSGGADCPSRAYSDLDAGEWYHEATDYAIREGLLTGFGDGAFHPAGKLSRAMLAQILWNHAGKPSAAESRTFSDVPENEWYSEAVGWAASAEVVSGYTDGSFGPSDNVTREQFAVMLWRYAGSPAGAAALDFRDAEQISRYALEALRWAVGEGILSGKSGNRLDPQGAATRAETAQMLYNFLNNE